MATWNLRMYYNHPSVCPPRHARFHNSKICLGLSLIFVLGQTEILLGARVSGRTGLVGPFFTLRIDGKKSCGLGEINRQQGSFTQTTDFTYEWKMPDLNVCRAAGFRLLLDKKCVLRIFNLIVSEGITNPWIGYRDYSRSFRGRGTDILIYILSNSSSFTNS